MVFRLRGVFQKYPHHPLLVLPAKVYILKEKLEKSAILAHLIPFRGLTTSTPLPLLNLISAPKASKQELIGLFAILFSHCLWKNL